MKLRRAFAFCLSLLALLAVAQPSHARNRALLIGAADYTGAASGSFNDLYGPRNDVTMMWRYLKASGVAEADIAVLSDGLPAGADFPKAAALADYAPIIARLEALARESYAPGDWVVIYYSGHGTHVTDFDGDAIPEAGGEDSVLMPTDTGAAKKGGTHIPKSLVDDELGAMIDAIRARGANVWAIIDSCHSGAATRGAEGYAKGVDPAVLGIENAPASSTRGAPRTGPFAQDMADGPGRGAFVGFYAVDPFNLAWELPFEFAAYQLPVVPAVAKKRRMSVFTQALHRSLTLGRPTTFAALFQDTLSSIAANPLTTGKPRPVADGNLGLALPWGASGGGGIPAHFEKGFISIAAGAFHGFDKGARVAFTDPADAAAAVAHGVVIEATPVNSIAGDVVWASGKEPGLARSLRASLERAPTDMVFRVAKPEGGGTAAALLENALAADAGAKLGIGVADTGDESAQLMTTFEDGRLWIHRPGEAVIKDPLAFGATFGLRIDGDAGAAAAEIRDTVWKLSRAERLVRAAANGMAAAGKAKELSFTLGRFRDGEAPADPRVACGRAMNSNGTAATLTEDEEERLEPPLGNQVDAGNCDVVSISAANLTWSTPYHVGAFYVQADGAIIALSPISGKGGANARDGRDNCAFPLPPRQDRSLQFEVQIGTWDAKAQKPYTVGLERIVLLAVKENAQRVPPDLCGLQQSSAAPRRDTRGDMFPEIDALIGGIAGWGLRGETVRSAEMAAEMESFLVELNVRP